MLSNSITFHPHSRPKTLNPLVVTPNFPSLHSLVTTNEIPPFKAQLLWAFSCEHFPKHRVEFFSFMHISLLSHILIASFLFVGFNNRIFWIYRTICVSLLLDFLRAGTIIYFLCRSAPSPGPSRQSAQWKKKNKIRQNKTKSEQGLTANLSIPGWAKTWTFQQICVGHPR